MISIAAGQRRRLNLSGSEELKEIWKFKRNSQLHGVENEVSIVPDWYVYTGLLL